jgi:hypothetical protein
MRILKILGGLIGALVVFGIAMNVYLKSQLDGITEK